VPPLWAQRPHRWFRTKRPLAQLRAPEGPISHQWLHALCLVRLVRHGHHGPISIPGQKTRAVLLGADEAEQSFVEVLVLVLWSHYTGEQVRTWQLYLFLLRAVPCSYTVPYWFARCGCKSALILSYYLPWHNHTKLDLSKRWCFLLTFSQMWANWHAEPVVVHSEVSFYLLLLSKVFFEQIVLRYMTNKLQYVQK